MIATAASEGIVKVLDFGTGKTIASFEGKGNPHSSYRFDIFLP